MLTSEERMALIIAWKLIHKVVQPGLRKMSYFYTATKFDLGDVIVLLTV